MVETQEMVSRTEFRAIADRVELTELLSRYHQAVDSLDWEGLRRVFTPDARCAYLGLDLFGAEDSHLEGREKIIAWLQGGLGQLADGNPRHFFSNHVFNVQGDTAHSRSYMHGFRPHIGGLYEIDHVRTPEGWRIKNLSLMHFSADPKRREPTRQTDSSE
jgi:hypothetical protein